MPIYLDELETAYEDYLQTMKRRTKTHKDTDNLLVNGMYP